MVITVAALQSNPGSDRTANIDRMVTQLEQARRRGAELAVLSEYCLYRGAGRGLAPQAERVGGPLTMLLRTIARHLAMNIVVGSIVEKSATPKKYYNTSLYLAADGTVAAAYRKRHLFMSTVRTARVDETRWFCAGTKTVTCRLGHASLGAALCFDLRYPEHFRELRRRGARMMCVPSDFTHTTGRAHWGVLVRSRAIETQSFVIAPNCCGVNPATGVRSYGHSMIVDPWGTVLAVAGERESVIVARCDMTMCDQVRARIPLGHA